jgi:hypothetical protein
MRFVRSVATGLPFVATTAVAVVAVVAAVAALAVVAVVAAVGTSAGVEADAAVVCSVAIAAAGAAACTTAAAAMPLSLFLSPLKLPRARFHHSFFSAAFSAACFSKPWIAQTAERVATSDSVLTSNQSSSVKGWYLISCPSTLSCTQSKNDSRRSPLLEVGAAVVVNMLPKLSKLSSMLNSKLLLLS